MQVNHSLNSVFPFAVTDRNRYLVKNCATMKLTYIYHSGFAIESDSFAMLIDYYKDTGADGRSGFVHEYLLNRPGKLYVLSSHAHADHFNKEVLSWQEKKKEILYLFSNDIATSTATANDIVYLGKTDEFEDDNLKITAFGSTDVGVSFLIETGGKIIFHAGDLNNWHWNEESTEEESRDYENAFLNELQTLVQTTRRIDLAMFPVDPRLGKDYMRGAEQFIDAISTKIFVPMHFGDKYEKAAAFGGKAEARGCRFIALSHKGESIVF